MLMEKNLTATVYEMNTKLSVSSSIFIFSICHFAVVGLSEMLAIKIPKRVPTEVVEVDLSNFQPHVTSASRVIVYLPDEPKHMLSTLNIFSQFIKLINTPLPTLILTNHRPEWIYHTLTYQIREIDILPYLCTLPIKTPVTELLMLLQTDISSLLLTGHVQEVKKRISVRTQGMTKREFETALLTLHGKSVMEISQYTGRSIKTLYRQIEKGMRKLQAEYPSHLLTL